MIESDFKLFNNELSVDSTNSQQNWKYVLKPLNETKYVIYCDGILFHKFLNTDQKLLK